MSNNKGGHLALCKLGPGSHSSFLGPRWEAETGRIKGTRKDLTIRTGGQCCTKWFLLPGWPHLPPLPPLPSLPSHVSCALLSDCLSCLIPCHTLAVSSAQLSPLRSSSRQSLALTLPGCVQCLSSMFLHPAPSLHESRCRTSVGFGLSLLHSVWTPWGQRLSCPSLHSCVWQSACSPSDRQVFSGWLDGWRLCKA